MRSDGLAPLIPMYLYVGRHGMPRPPHLYDYILAEQGLIKRVENRFAAVDCLLAPLEETLYGLNLQPYPLQPLRFKLPRIPGRLLAETLAEARREIEREVMYHFKYDPGEGWTVSRPAQEQSRVSVGYRYRDPDQIILDLHSHHRMPAFFSPTDDRDERGGRFYGVIGHLDRETPELALRLGLYGHWLYNVPAALLFEETGPLVEVWSDRSRGAALSDSLLPAPTGGWLRSFFSHWRRGR